MRPPRFQLLPLEDRLTPVALLQLINDTPRTTGVQSPVDVFVNGAPVADDLQPGTGTRFLEVPSGAPVEVRYTGGPAAGQALTLADGTRNVAVLSGGELAGVTVPAPDPGGVAIVVYNAGGTPVDVRVSGGGTVANDLPAGKYGPTATVVRAGPVTATVAQPDGATRLRSVGYDLGALAGQGVTLLVRGRPGPFAGRFAPNPGVIAVRADGAAAPGGPPTGPAVAASGGGVAGLLDRAGAVLLTGAVPRQVGAAVAAADVTGDAVLDRVEASVPGAAQAVTATDGATGRPLFTVSNPFEPSFTGGLLVAAGDLNADGAADLVVTPDQGGGGRVRVLSGRDQSVLADFFGIEDPNFRGGARAAVGDVTGDGRPDLLVAAGFGGGPRVAVYDGADLAPGRVPRKVVGDFFVFEPTLRNGVFLAAGDLDGDGRADPVFGGGPGGGPRVFAVGGADLTANSRLTPVADFFAGDPAGRGGVRVATADLDGDAQADVVAGLGGAGDPQVRGFLGRDLRPVGLAPVAVDVSPFPRAAGDAVFVG